MIKSYTTSIIMSASYSGIKKLFNEAYKKAPTITRQDVKEWLSGELVYTLHKPVRKRFKRNPIIVQKINENFQADLVDMREFSNQNNGYNYILTVIDVFSKKAFGIPLKNKTSQSVSSAMDTILKVVSPSKLQTDQGKEFENSIFKNLMKSYEINHFTTKNTDIKCSIVERFNKTLKNKMFRHFTKIGNRKYIDIVSSLISSYNNTYHRTIKMAPNEVNESNEDIVFRNIYGVNNVRDLLRKYKKPTLSIGETVRKKYKFGPLDRGYYPNWTDEVYTIYKTMNKHRFPLYQIKDSKNKQLKQSFYLNELQKIKDNKIYRVENILKERKYKGVKQYFVKWLNHSSSENSWVAASDVFDISNGK